MVTYVDFGRPSFLSYKILQLGFIVLPIIAGIDKFFNILTHWSVYLSPVISHMIDGQVFMKAVGVIEIAAGIVVAFKPKYGAVIVTLWLWAIILNLITVHLFYDIALRDFGLSLGSLALANLAVEYQT